MALCGLADKGYASAANRKNLINRGWRDGILYKAARGKPLTATQKQANRRIKSKRWAIEQSFGTLKRRFHCYQANYFGRKKVLGQSYLKAMCLNLLKASDKVCYV